MSKTNRARLESLTQDDIQALIKSHPVIINDVVSGFLWNTGEVGRYIPVLTKTFIDWPSVNLKKVKRNEYR